ncbi:MAG: adenosine kinase [Microthrixaceae bacterium]
MIEPTVDVVGIGNALVDVISQEPFEFVESEGLVAGSMNLIDTDRRHQLYGAMSAGEEHSGGSCANTTVGVGSLGGTAHYLGRVADDQLGEVFAHDIRAAGVGFDNEPAPEGPPTGCSLVIVTPDGQRTMNTYLGAAELFGPDDVAPDSVRTGRVLYLEGYLFDRPEAKEAFRFASGVAHEAGRSVAHPQRPVLRRPPPLGVPRVGVGTRRPGLRERERAPGAVRDRRPRPRPSGTGDRVSVGRRHPK